MAPRDPGDPATLPTLAFACRISSGARSQRHAGRAACVTVNPVASESNRRAERCCSRYGEPGSEAADALMVADWGQSFRPGCWAIHRGVVYAFPQEGRIKPVVRKTVADAAPCVLVVPVAITAPYWHKLL